MLLLKSLCVLSTYKSQKEKKKQFSVVCGREVLDLNVSNNPVPFIAAQYTLAKI